MIKSLVQPDVERLGLPTAGLEPARPFELRILSPLRLPFRQAGKGGLFYRSCGGTARGYKLSGMRHSALCPWHRVPYASVARLSMSYVQSARRRSKDGLTTRILVAIDALGQLARLFPLSGQRHDTISVAPLIKDAKFGGLIADKAFDADWLTVGRNDRCAKVVTSRRLKRNASSTDRQVTSHDQYFGLQAQGVQTGG